MKKLSMKITGLAFVMAFSASQVQAQHASDEAFIQCMQDCQDWQPDARTVRQCENWCYAYYNPN